MVNFEWYRTFKAIYQTGTLTGAAQELFISQPNVSQHLSALEAYVGQKLFDRKPRKMVPTYHGKLFYAQVVEAVEKLERVEADFKQASLSKHLPVVRVGAVQEFFYAVLADRISSAASNLAVEFGLTKNLISQLIKGELDFVFATQRTEENGLTFQPIKEETFVVVANPGLDTRELDSYLEASQLQQAEQWLLAQTWFAYSSDLAIIRRFWQVNFKKRPLLKPRFVIPDMTAILRSISYGQGVTVSADYLVQELVQQGKLKIIWKGHTPTTNTIYLVYDKNKVTDQQLGVITPILNLSSGSM